jgi:hypothetical protein
MISTGAPMLSYAEIIATVLDRARNASERKKRKRKTITIQDEGKNKLEAIKYG